MCEQLNFWRQTCQNIGGRLPHGILNFPPDFPRKIKERSRTVMLFQEIESQYIGFIGVLVISSKRIEFNLRVRPMKLRVCIQAKGKRERLSFFLFTKLKMRAETAIGYSNNTCLRGSLQL